MKKNRLMRAAAMLLALTLITSCWTGATLARYTSSADSEDEARTAEWGFDSVTMDLSNLFSTTYDGNGDASVNSNNTDDVIAPGTSGSASFIFAYDEAAGPAPEVAYTFEVDVTDYCGDLIKNNKNIVWSLDSALAPEVRDEGGNVVAAAGTWDALVAAIKALSGEADGSVDYAPNTLPDAFGTDDTEHTIAWEWKFTGGGATYDHDNDPNTDELSQDEYDTFMGNADTLDNCSIQITITATQLDAYAANP